MAYSLVAVPNNFSFLDSIFVMMYVFVGGLAHSLAGPIIGAIVVTFTPEYFRLAKEYESIITAASSFSSSYSCPWASSASTTGQ